MTSEARAKKVARILKIPFLVFSLEKEFKKRIINHFLNENRKGLTPNPCIACNKEIKFGLFLEKALELKAQELLRSLKKPEQVLDIREDGTLLLILPDADRPLAQRNARDILIAAAYRKIPMGAMVVSYQLGWSQDKLLSLPARGFTQGQEFPPQILGVYQADKGIFEFVEDLPVVSPQSPPEEWSQEETEEVNTSGMDEEVGF